MCTGRPHRVCPPNRGLKRGARRSPAPSTALARERALAGGTLARSWPPTWPLACARRVRERFLCRPDRREACVRNLGVGLSRASGSETLRRDDRSSWAAYTPSVFGRCAASSTRSTTRIGPAATPACRLAPERTHLSAQVIRRQALGQAGSEARLLHARGARSQILRENVLGPMGG